MPAGGVPNYLVQAILVTLFCCLPFGIVAIVYAAQVNGKLSGGDIDGAMESSRKAKIWSWISFGVGLGIVMYIILVMLRVAI
ncbi:MAG: CD225/dispanin family protein [Armatimonadetes bacterium]|nr:CD225/dispanin family protein [Armatimonadota bacterium]NIO98998.1 CD225/dispanin family protein [Armatimonadota bacterium]